MAVPGEVRDRSALHEERISLPRGSDLLPVYVARPRQAATPLPGVVVVHEAFGLTPHIEDVCRRVAARGLLAAAPDLFHRLGGPAGDPPQALARLASLDDGEAVADLVAVVGWLRRQPQSNGRVGAIGFCMGGRLVLLLATESGVLDCAIDCWGGRMTRRTALIDERHPEVAVERIERLSCPLLGIFGEEDENPNLDDVAELRAALQRYGKDHRIVTYPGAGHAFFADYRDSYREGPAFAAWEEFGAWLDRLR